MIIIDIKLIKIKEDFIMEKRKFEKTEVEYVALTDVVSTSPYGDTSDEWDENSVSSYPVY